MLCEDQKEKGEIGNGELVNNLSGKEGLYIFNQIEPRVWNMGAMRHRQTEEPTKVTQGSEIHGT